MYEVNYFNKKIKGHRREKIRKKLKLVKCENDCVGKFGSDEVFEGLSRSFLGRFGRFLLPDISETFRKVRQIASPDL